MAGRALLIGAVVAVAISGSASADPPYDAGTHLCRLQDDRITESSGAAVASFDDGLLWTHNDSGGGARFFLVDVATCQTAATYELEGGGSLDWEDVARGVTSDGRPTLLFADIGDNFQFRSTTTVYEVLEPDGTGDDDSVPVRAVHTLTYPHGARDAETLLFVAPTRQLAVVTKPRDADRHYTGHSELYLAAPDLSEKSGTVRMTKAADIDFTALAGFDASEPDSYAASGGAVSHDGRHVVVRCYFDAYEWPVGPGFDLGAAVSAAPLRIPLLPERQGEGVSYTNDDGALLTTSEGAASPIDRYEGTPSPTTTTTSTTLGALPVGRDDDNRSRSAAIAAGAALVATVLLAFVLRRRRS